MYEKVKRSPPFPPSPFLATPYIEGRIQVYSAATKAEKEERQNTYCWYRIQPQIDIHRLYNIYIQKVTHIYKIFIQLFIYILYTYIQKQQTYMIYTYIHIHYIYIHTCYIHICNSRSYTWYLTYIHIIYIYEIYIYYIQYIYEVVYIVQNIQKRIHIEIHIYRNNRIHRKDI